jgi:hypothetical protein
VKTVQVDQISPGEWCRIRKLSRYQGWSDMDNKNGEGVLVKPLLPKGSFAKTGFSLKRKYTAGLGERPKA